VSDASADPNIEAALEPDEILDPTPESDLDPDAVVGSEPGSVEELVVALESVTHERDQHLSDLQRVSAEFANFRKQTEKRNAEFAAQAGSRVATALLPVLDACDAAAQHGVEGIEAIGAQLRGELERSGLEVIGEVNEAFDPNRHEAAMTEPGDDDQDGPVVAAILRTGYGWNGRVLRAAMVKVKG